jgi:hypothetical protein
MLKLNKLALCLTRNALLHWFSACFCRALFCLWVATLSSVVHAQTRSAFVVGNNEYVDLPSLANAINDATGLAAELRKSGFEVTHLSNAKASVFKDGLARFLGSVANGGTGVFYFAGHGAQILGRNYLAPVDFSFNRFPLPGWQNRRHAASRKSRGRYQRARWSSMRRVPTRRLWMSSRVRGPATDCLRAHCSRYSAKRTSRSVTLHSVSDTR